MKNKMKIFLIFALVIQLFVPSFLLTHHYSLIKTAMLEKTEYLFVISYLEFWSDDKKYTAEEVDSLHFSVYDTVGLYNERIAVSADENGIARLSELGDKKTDIWFDYDYYDKSQTIPADRFSFTEEASPDIVRELHQRYFWYNRNDENKEYAYLSVKVYKGIFIPTAIYYKGEKIMTIDPPM